MIFELKRIDIWSVVKIVFIMFLMIGISFGLFWSMIVMFFTEFFSGFGEEFGLYEFTPPSPIISIMAFSFLGVLQAVVVSLLTTIALSLYNILSRLLGGFKFEFEEETKTAAQIHHPVQPVQQIPGENPDNISQSEPQSPIN